MLRLQLWAWFALEVSLRDKFIGSLKELLGRGGEVGGHGYICELFKLIPRYYSVYGQTTGGSHDRWPQTGSFLHAGSQVWHVFHRLLCQDRILLGKNFHDFLAENGLFIWIVGQRIEKESSCIRCLKESYTNNSMFMTSYASYLTVSTPAIIISSAVTIAIFLSILRSL